MPRLVRRRVVVHGRVHGVGFRVSVASRARARGVSGWVRNRGDGSVEAVFEGDRESVLSLVAYCEEGPRGSSVERVDVEEEAPAGLASFEIG